jgi:glycerol kinase
MQYIVALDQGTTSSRAVLFDQQGQLIGIEQQEFNQYYPKPGWVEHDPEEIWETQWQVLQQLLKKYQVSPQQVAAIGITNQRETTVVWDKATGKPVYPAIVWQDKRTAPFCEELKKRGLSDYVREHTGLVIDSYFSATKIKWILDHVEGAMERAQQGGLLFGTIDTWLLWKASGGKIHATDMTNASRTLLYNIGTLSWDNHLLEVFGVPHSMLPTVNPSAARHGFFMIEGQEVPVLGIAGDQQAALFGQACFEPGTAKNTYGTGCFMLMNTGERRVQSENGLITTIAWGLEGKVTYALEGSIFIAGAAVQWLRDGLKIITNAAESEAVALSAGEEDEVYVVPAFAGLGAPYWDMFARGAIFGLTRDSGQAQLVKATLQSLAYQTKDVLDAMEQDAGILLKNLKVDGGACANNYLMQFQADLLGVSVERPEIIESTALGAAYLAGIQSGLWAKDQIMENRKIDKVFQVHASEATRNRRYQGWQKAVKRTMHWLDNDE